MKTECLVITTIAAPNAALREFAQGCESHGISFVVIGDTKSPGDFHLENCDFYSVERQLQTGFEFAQHCPTKHYARKNIGYLLAAQSGAQVIRETDDDNLPRPEFFSKSVQTQMLSSASGFGWINVYRWFTDSQIWPRGLPLDRVTTAPPEFSTLPIAQANCPIQQGLADENPDVDAVYRLLFPLPQNFRKDRRVALGKGAWCPFNSQNTTWFREAFPLLYLPAYCTFRMTDIWRSLVAQRIAWENDWSILFHEPTVWQDRNAHDLMADFKDELPGYLHNQRIREALEELPLRSGPSQIPDNMLRCYERLCELELVGSAEMGLLAAWLADLAQASLKTPSPTSMDPASLIGTMAN